MADQNFTIGNGYYEMFQEQLEQAKREKETFDRIVRERSTNEDLDDSFDDSDDSAWMSTPVPAPPSPEPKPQPKVEAKPEKPDSRTRRLDID